MGLLLLTLTICGLALHAWLFIEIQLNEIVFKEFAFVRPDKIVNPRKNAFNKSKYFHLHYIIFFH